MTIPNTPEAIKPPQPESYVRVITGSVQLSAKISTELAWEIIHKATALITKLVAEEVEAKQRILDQYRKESLIDEKAISNGCQQIEQLQAQLREANEALRRAEGDRQSLRSVIQGVIDGAVHPDKAVRRVMVDLAPLRAAMRAAGGSVGDKPQPITLKQSTDLWPL